MFEGQPLISEYDYWRIVRLVHRQLLKRGSQNPQMRELYDGIHQAVIVDPDEIPPDLVTMNSVVRLRQPGEDRDLTVRLIFPSKEESSEEAVSVLDPLGMAMLGYRVGDSVFVTRNGITESYVIDSIPYQPEASGDYQL